MRGTHTSIGPGRIAGDHRRSWAQGAPAEVKVAAAVLFVIGVVLTPREAFAAFGVHLGVLAAVTTLAGIPVHRLARRLAIEVPFVVFAAFLPFVAGGERVEWGPVSVSVEGSWAAWNIMAKATLGVLVAALLSATTDVPDLLVGLRRLRVPAPLVTIAAFMTRYLDVLVAQLGRMQIARISRGDDPRWLWQARAVAATSGTLFLRSYERGERVYLAMCARGFTGESLVPGGGAPARLRQWLLGLIPAGVALVVAAVAHVSMS